MRILYNILFACLFVLSSPYYFLRLKRRGNWQAGFAQRFGRYDSKFKQAITNRHTLWLHAVSVGEVNVCTRLIQELERRLPNLKIVVSTTTTTGMGELQRKLPVHVSRIYYPIDFARCVRSALKTVRPEAIVLVEAEIWPNFLWRAQAMGIPVFLVNARLSKRSFPRYKFFSFLFRPLFASFTAVGAQNENDAEKLRQLGCQPEAVHVVGSLKYDAASAPESQGLNVAAMLRQLGVAEGAPVLVAGSTHAGEESLLARMAVRLRSRFPDLFLVLVPRHFERGPEVGRELDALGVKFATRSDLTPATQYEPGSLACLLVNTTGELRYFYRAATLVFIGKSISAVGGQNPIEPAALGKAIVFGPNMQNFSDVASDFLRCKGAIQVKDADELEKVVGELLEDIPRREELGRNAREVVQKNQGALQHTVEMLVGGLAERELYVAPQRQRAAAADPTGLLRET